MTYISADQTRLEINELMRQTANQKITQIKKTEDNYMMRTKKLVYMIADRILRMKYGNYWCCSVYSRSGSVMIAPPPPDMDEDGPCTV